LGLVAVRPRVMLLAITQLARFAARSHFAWRTLLARLFSILMAWRFCRYLIIFSRHITIIETVAKGMLTDKNNLTNP